MAKVNKVDYYCGAFLSYLIMNKVEPTLFSVTEKSKVVDFLLKNTDYNAFVKYAAAPTPSKLKGKDYTRWDFIFSKSEREYLFNNFCKENHNNIVVLVCANKDSKNTYFAVLSYEQTVNCLGNDEVNKSYRIAVKHQKSSKYSYCYGTAKADNNAEKILFDTDNYFGFL